jgi:hypothetical protein
VVIIRVPAELARSTANRRSERGWGRGAAGQHNQGQMGHEGRGDPCADLILDLHASLDDLHGVGASAGRPGVCSRARPLLLRPRSRERGEAVSGCESANVGARIDRAWCSRLHAGHSRRWTEDMAGGAAVNDMAAAVAPASIEDTAAVQDHRETN